MYKQNRRDFIKAGVNLLGAAGLSPLLGSFVNNENLKPKGWTGFNYCMCNESMQDLPWQQQCEIISSAGYKAVEIAAFTLVKESVKELTTSDRNNLVAAMNNAGIVCQGLHWLLAPPPQGFHFTTPDKQTRQRSVSYLHELIDFCGDLGGTYLTFGSPKQRNTIGVSIDEAKKFFAEGLASVADHAAQRGTKVLIEALDKSQTDVVNTMAEAMDIVEKVDHPAIQTMFDFHNTANETEPFEVLIKKYYPHIFHVHVMEMDGRHLGTGNGVSQYITAFQTLKDLHYDRWVSLEVFDFSPGGKVIAEESMKVLKQIESKLV
jgi:D-psicose/D-tagatose/L-ribulose 3-epimerase